MGINTENSVIRGSEITLKDTNPLLDQCQPQLRAGWSRTSNPFVRLSPGEKRMEPNQLFLICIWWCIWLWLIWVSFKILMSLFFFPAKLRCHILLQGISDATNVVIYHAVTIEKSERKKFLNSVSRFVL